MTDAHFKRYTAEKIKNALEDTPIVFVMSPRQSGKTTLVRDCPARNEFAFDHLRKELHSPPFFFKLIDFVTFHAIKNQNSTYNGV